jgi:LysM repeat protein
MRRVVLVGLMLVAVLSVAPAALAQEGETVHIVQPGENLYRIALQYGLTYQELAAYNGIVNPAAIQIGQTIRIPAAAASGTSGGTSAEEVIHIVQAGENLYRIALRYGRTYQEIATYNGITNPAAISVGQEIRIPGQTATTPQTTPAPQAPVSGAVGSSTPFGYGLEMQLIGVDRDQVMNAAQELGVTWIKQEISWAEMESTQGTINWSALDAVVTDVRNRGFFLLLSVRNAPDWARTTTEGDGPPDDYADFATFMGAVAERYQGQGIAYEIWSEQNLQRAWNGAPLSAADYVEMLGLAYGAIHAADSTAIVVSGGLAPTGWNDGVTAIDDRVYLTRMYEAGLAQYSDAVGAHPLGWANPPDATCCQPAAADIITHYNHASFYFHDTIEDYRAIMVAHGDGNTKLWLTSIAWGSNEGISGSIPAGYEYVVYNSAAEQAAYITGAFQAAQGMGFVGPTFLSDLNFCPASGGQASQCYWSLVLADWSHRPAYDELRDATP